MDQSSNNKRIAKNSIYLYIRMLLVMGVTLYTSRVVLQALGITDFGIYNVVGGLVSILAFFTSSLSNASQRYISIGLGKNDFKETSNAFRQSFTLMLVLSFLILFIGETLGLWFVFNKLVIPQDRLHAAVWVYHFSLLSIVFALNQVSLMAAIVAHERMNVYAYLGLFEAIARLMIVWVLMFVGSIDSLVLYGTLTALISVVTFLFYLVYCIRYFEECRISLYWNRGLVKDMGRFISYNLFGCFAYSAGIQGTNIILNMFFGPAVNAARAISVQVSTVVTRFTDSIMTAVKPQIIKSYVTGEKQYMFMIIEKSSKYAYFLAAIFAIPVMFEIEFILNLWLGQVPEYSAVFTRLVLCEALFNVFAPPLWIAANATGNIKNNQVYGRMITLLILPISYIILLVYANPNIPFFITVCASMLYWLYCFYDINKQISLPVISYIVNVVKPAVIFTMVLIAFGITIVNIISDDSWLRFVVLFGVLVVVGLIACYILLDESERDFIKKIIIKRILR